MTFVDQRHLERVDRVLAREMEAAAGHHLGEHRALEDERGHEVGGRRGDQEGQQPRIGVVSLSGKTTPVSGERITPPTTAHSPTSAQNPRLAEGHAPRARRALPDHQRRRQHSARGLRAQRQAPDQRLDDQDPDDQREPGPTGEQLVDHVAADPKIIGRFPGETSALSTIWAGVLELSSRARGGVMMTPKPSHRSNASAAAKLPAPTSPPQPTVRR